MSALDAPILVNDMRLFFVAVDALGRTLENAELACVSRSTSDVSTFPSVISRISFIFIPYSLLKEFDAAESIIKIFVHHN